MTDRKASSSSSTPRHDARRWARYWALKRLTFIRRRIWVHSFHEFGDLYGGQWERVEEQLIRSECEEHGVPMGYGRVGRPPRQLTWSMALPSEESYDPTMADEVSVTVVDDAELPPEKVAELASEVSKWEKGDAADGTWKDAPEAIIAQPGKTVVVRRRSKKAL